VGSSSRWHDKCHNGCRYETYNDLSLAEVTDLCRNAEIDLSNVQKHDNDHALAPHFANPSPELLGTEVQCFQRYPRFNLLRILLRALGRAAFDFFRNEARKMPRKSAPFEILSELAKSSTSTGLHRPTDPQIGQTIALKRFTQRFGEKAADLEKSARRTEGSKDLSSSHVTPSMVLAKSKQVLCHMEYSRDSIATCWARKRILHLGPARHRRQVCNALITPTDPISFTTPRAFQDHVRLGRARKNSQLGVSRSATLLPKQRTGSVYPSLHVAEQVAVKEVTANRISKPGRHVL